MKETMNNSSWKTDYVPDEDEIIQGLQEFVTEGKLFMRYSIKMDFKTIRKI